MFDVETLFRESDPARRTAIPSARSEEGQWLCRQVTSGTPPQRGSAHGPRVRIAAGVGLVGVVAAVVALVVPGSPGAPTTAAAAALTRLALVAADRPASSPLPTGEYAYTASVGVEVVSQVHEQQPTAGTSGSSGAVQQTFSVLAPVTRQVWIAADGSGRLLQSYGTPSFLTSADRAAWVADGEPPVLQPSSNVDSLEAKGALAGPSLAGLPTDPARLLADIEARKVEDAPDGESYTFKIVGDLLRETNAPPALRAALYQAAAKIPGVALVGTVSDAVGRSGTAVAYTSNGVRDELIFDPTTSALLGEVTVVTDPSQLCRLDVSVGTVVGETSYVAAGVANSTSAVPTGTSIASYHVAIPTNASDGSSGASGSPRTSDCPPAPDTTVPPVSTTLPPS
jgi:hypothetical protein